MRSFRVLLVLASILPVSGCSSGQYATSPSLDPRESRVVRFHVPDLLEGRDCSVYLPAGYAGPGRRYPVLYVVDGESAFDRGNDGESFGFDTAADAMIARGEIEPLLIVAIHSEGHRFRDYIPVITNGSLDTTQAGGAFLRSFREQLKRRIDRMFATDPSPGATGITGFSLGGLIAATAGYGDPGTFGIMGAFSGSYGERAVAWFEAQGKPAGGSLWIDTGTIADNLFHARLLNRLALDQGFVPDADYEYREVEGGTHTIPSVRTRVPAFLAFFSRRSSSATESAQLVPEPVGGRIREGDQSFAAQRDPPMIAHSDELDLNPVSEAKGSGFLTAAAATQLTPR